MRSNRKSISQSQEMGSSRRKLFKDGLAESITPIPEKAQYNEQTPNDSFIDVLPEFVDRRKIAVLYPAQNKSIVVPQINGKFKGTYQVTGQNSKESNTSLVEAEYVPMLNYVRVRSENEFKQVIN